MRTTSANEQALDAAFIKAWAKKYPLGRREGRLFDEVSAAVAAQGHFTKEQFLEVGDWKSPRSKGRMMSNPPEDVQELTRMALGCSPHLRIRVLSVLAGVGRGIASALLTVWQPKAFTVIDWRAIESLRYFGYFSEYSDQVPYQHYLDVCCGVAKASRVDLRTLDRALWTFSQIELSPDKRRGV